MLFKVSGDNKICQSIFKNAILIKCWAVTSFQSQKRDKHNTMYKYVRVNNNYMGDLSCKRVLILLQ